MESILNLFWGLIDALPPVLTASLMMLFISGFAALVLLFVVGAITLRKEGK
ncbi:hypothetical protein BXY66_2015 [Shimia isoporae]|uniref:Uncharacterized protein n=1 Tax=Shimia isoporae TaxID=647720 RepID=A0A4R1NXF5_9RHOB|nr:hypothetical protein [Shimia isoporae]TCL09948.1 hypothetical protein BXY66_2015 [Shimia isoporae]